MKRFITIIMAIAIAVSASFTAKAQYAYQPMQVDTIKVAPNQMFNYMQIPEYRLAKEKADKGRKMFWEGLVTQAIGAGLVALTAGEMVKEVSYTSYDGSGSYESVSTNGLAQLGYVLGWGGVVVGGILEVAGAFKWADGAGEMHDLRIMYSPTRIVVAF